MFLAALHANFTDSVVAGNAPVSRRDGKTVHGRQNPRHLAIISRRLAPLDEKWEKSSANPPCTAGQILIFCPRSAERRPGGSWNVRGQQELTCMMDEIRAKRDEIYAIARRHKTEQLRARAGNSKAKNKWLNARVVQRSGGREAERCPLYAALSRPTVAESVGQA